MLRSGHFNTRHLNAYHFNGGSDYPEDQTDYFKAHHLKAGHFSGLQHFSSLPSGPGIVELYVGSIAIEVLPTTLYPGDPVVIIAYVYDQFNKPLVAREVSFASSNTGVLNAPTNGFSDTLGRVVRSLSIGGAGGTSLSVTSGGYTATTSITVLAGGPTPIFTLTQGATIQVGSPGGGVGGPVKYTRNSRKRWPTR
jgi:hypothetical protein